MATNVQIQFNPFQQQLNILIDGKQLSEYSCLIQFADEDIWQWHSEILDALYNELQDNFLLTFIGTETDAYSARTAHPFQRNGAPFRFKLSKAQQVD